MLRIARRAPSGRGDEVRFNPYWVRVQMDDPPHHWSQLTLFSHGKVLKIGTFLAPDEARLVCPRPEKRAAAGR